MDSLTQIILGAAVGEAALGKKAGNKAMLYGAIAGTIPDLDTLAGYFTDTISAIEIHRGFTHSILFSIVFGILFGWIISKREWKLAISWKEWSWLMFLGLFTHSLLDAHTSWGTQLFWPLEYRIAYKNIFVIDPLYTISFLIFLILALRSKKGSKKRRIYNNLGLFVSSSYMLLTILLKGITYTAFTEALDEQKITYKQIETRPTALNSVLWTAHIEVEEAYLIGTYSLFDTQPITFKSYPKNHQLLGDLAQDKNIKRLIKITEGWYTVTKQEDHLFFNDLRFGILNSDKAVPQFAFSYELIRDNGVIMAEEVPKSREDGKKLLKTLWFRILGN